MPKLKHKTPCKQCPFRRKSLPGYLGASYPDEFLFLTIHADEHMPCHVAINYEKKDWQTKQLPNAAHCAGSLIFMKNQCKQPVDAELRARKEQVEIDTETVFQWPSEFLTHHKRGQ